MGTDHLLARARLYQALAVAYGYPAAGQRRRAQTLLGELDSWARGLGDGWTEALAGLSGQLATDRLDAVECDFNRLFSGPMTCSPHETAYEPDVFRRQRALADIAGFYTAFGFALGEHSRWQLDHLGVELEFCAILLQRGALALECGHDEPAAVCEHALRAFLLDHPGRWLGAFSRRLARLAAVGTYRVLAELTGRWVTAELDLHRLRPEPLAERPRSLEDEMPPACGATTGHRPHRTAPGA